MNPLVNTIQQLLSAAEQADRCTVLSCAGAISGVQILHLRQFLTVNHRTMCSQLLDELEALTTHTRVSGPPLPPPP